jgi:hypothetical protein
LKWFDILIERDFSQTAGGGIGCNACLPTGRIQR